MEQLTTETLLTSPAAFALTTATPCQRAICRIVDGLPLGELASHPDVSALVGGAEALAALPTRAPSIAIILAAIRTAKTMTAGAAGSKMALTVDLRGLKHGEIPRVSIVSLKLDTSAVAFQQIVGAWEASPMLRPLILERTADTLTVRHPSGRPVEIACVAGAKAGSGLVARWSAGVIFDEAPRMAGKEDGIINLDDALNAVMGRLLPGASVLAIGSPWAPYGPVYDLVQQHWGKPSEHAVVMRGTGPMLNPTHWTPERCAALEERNPAAHQTDVLGEFADPETGLLNPLAIKRNTRESPLEIPRVYGAKYLAGMDQSDGQPGGNAWTLVIIRKLTVGTGVHKYQVVLAREWRSGGPSNILRECAQLCAKYRIHTVLADGYSGAANCDLARRWGLTLIPQRSTPAENLERFTNLATLIHTDQLELPPDRQFRRDLLSIKKKTTRDGYSIYLPRTADGRHADYAPALVSALAAQAHTIDREGLERRAEAIMDQISGETPTWKQWPEDAWTTVY